MERGARTLLAFAFRSEVPRAAAQSREQRSERTDVESASSPPVLTPHDFFRILQSCVRVADARRHRRRAARGGNNLQKDCVRKRHAAQRCNFCGNDLSSGVFWDSFLCFLFTLHETAARSLFVQRNLCSGHTLIFNSCSTAIPLGQTLLNPSLN